MKMNSQAVHAGRDGLGIAHVPSIDLSTTYRTPLLDEATENIDAMARGESPLNNPIYQRLHNPTVDRFEKAMSMLEGSEASVSFASGMAAVTASLLAAKMVGNHVIAVRPIYGGTDHLLACGLLGLEVSWARADDVHLYMRPDTAMVLCETPANPTLALIDIEDVVEQANGVPVLVDSTFATPILQKPLSHGATLVLHSGTKFLGGHGDVMAGVVSCSEEWAQRLRQVRILTGGNLHPQAAYTVHRGLQTLSIRVRAAQENARILVNKLCGHPAVERVLYPGLPSCDPKGLVGRQLRGGGSMIGIELREGYEAARHVMSLVRLFTPAVSLGSCDSLIQHPAGLTHRIVDSKARESGGITEGLLRLSIGLEDATDLWGDLELALNATMQGLALSAK
jgi:methionine-gamma-lyase